MILWCNGCLLKIQKLGSVDSLITNMHNTAENQMSVA